MATPATNKDSVQIEKSKGFLPFISQQCRHRQTTYVEHTAA